MFDFISRSLFGVKTPKNPQDIMIYHWKSHLKDFLPTQVNEISLLICEPNIVSFAFYLKTKNLLNIQLY